MKTITSAELKNKLNTDADFFLIDVRSNEEYDQGHIAKALFGPWETITERVKGIKPSQELILYCNTGVRAKKAASALEEVGYNNLSVLIPGWIEWNIQE